jgi:hypothetical protein
MGRRRPAPSGLRQIGRKVLYGRIADRHAPFCFGHAASNIATSYARAEIKPQPGSGGGLMTARQVPKPGRPSACPALVIDLSARMTVLDSPAAPSPGFLAIGQPGPLPLADEGFVAVPDLRRNPAFTLIPEPTYVRQS